MTSACIFKDTLSNDTQVFHKFGDSIFEICLHLINANFTSYHLLSSIESSGEGTSKEIPLQESGLFLPAILIILSFSFFQLICSIRKLSIFSFYNLTWPLIFQSIRWILMCWNKSPMSPVHKDTTPRTSLVRLNSHRVIQRECPQFTQLHPKEPQILTIDDDSIEPTMPYGFGRQLPIVPPSLNDLNLPPNPFNILAKMAVVNHTEDGNTNE